MATGGLVALRCGGGGGRLRGPGRRHDRIGHVDQRPAHGRHGPPHLRAAAGRRAWSWPWSFAGGAIGAGIEARRHVGRFLRPVPAAWPQARARPTRLSMAGAGFAGFGLDGGNGGALGRDMGTDGIDRRGGQQRGEDAGEERRQKRRRAIFRAERRDGGGEHRDDENGTAGGHHLDDAWMERAGHHKGKDTHGRRSRQQDRQHQNTQGQTLITHGYTSRPGRQLYARSPQRLTVCVENGGQAADKINERRQRRIAAGLGDCEQSVNRICWRSDATV